MIAIVALSVGNVGCQENYRLGVSLPETWGATGEYLVKGKR